MLAWVKRFLFGGAAGKLASGAAWLAVLAPLALWFASNKDTPLITISYGDAAFWGTVIWAIVMAARVSSPPPWSQRYR